MKGSGLIFVVLMAVATRGLAQTNATPAGSASDYFNLGSATFIRENPEKALPIVNEGLAAYPADESLLRLKKLLEQQQENQQQQQQQDQQNQDQPSQQDGQQQPQPAKPDEQKDGDKDQNRQDQQNPLDKTPGDENKDQQEQTAEGDVTKEEAEMMLDSLRQLEQAQREQLMGEMIRNKLPDMAPVEKDW